MLDFRVDWAAYEPGRGKRQIREEAALKAVIDGVLEQHDVKRLLTVICTSTKDIRDKWKPLIWR